MIPPKRVRHFAGCGRAYVVGVGPLPGRPYWFEVGTVPVVCNGGGMTFRTWVREHAHHLDTIDPDAPLEDLRPLDAIVRDARVVAVGEGCHFVEEFWTVRLRDLKGMHYLSVLLTDPGREYHVLSLVAAQTGRSMPVDSGQPATLPRSALGDAGEMLDAQAKDTYRRRLAEIDEDIEQAHANGDAERASQADTERDWLVSELARAFGLSGRGRKAHPPPNALAPR